MSRGNVSVPVSSIGSIPTNIRATPINPGGGLPGVDPISSTHSGSPIYAADGETVVGLRLANGTRIPVRPYRLSEQPREPIGNNLSRPGDGNYTGVNGPATYYQVHAAETESPSASDNLASVQSNLANFTTLSGQLNEEGQAALVEGLNLYEVQQIAGMLDQDALITFDLVDFKGATLYTNARFISADEAAELDQGTTGMNFPTAYQYALKGHPISHPGWHDEESGTQRWYLVDRGIEFIIDGNGRHFVESGVDGNVSAADLKRLDWHLTPQCRITPLPVQPTFGGRREDNGVNFDPSNPPCHIDHLAA